MKKYFFHFLTFLLLSVFVTPLLGAVYVYPGADTNLTTNGWAPGDVIFINSTTTFTGTRAINVPAVGYTSTPGFTIRIAPNQQMVVNGSLTIHGNSKTNGYLSVRVTSAGSHNGISFAAGSTGIITNATISNAINSIVCNSGSTVILDSIVFNAPNNAGVLITDSYPRVTNCNFICGTSLRDISMSFTAVPARLPYFVGNSFVSGTAAAGKHVFVSWTPASAVTFYLEGNYWNGAAPNLFSPSGLVSFDSSPDLSGSPYTLGYSYYNTGTINNPTHYVFSGENHRLGGNVTLANGASLLIGQDRENFAVSYIGNGTLSFDSGISLTALNGSTIRSTGAGILAAQRNYIQAYGGGTSKLWGQIQLQNGSTGTFGYTDITNAASYGLNILSGAIMTFSNPCSFNYNAVGVASAINLNIQNHTFDGNTTANQINAGGSGTFSGNKINPVTPVVNGCGFEINGGQGTFQTNTIANIGASGRAFFVNAGGVTTIQSNTFTGATVQNGFLVTGGSPTITNHNVTIGSTAVQVNGGTPSITNNTFTGDGSSTIFDIRGGTPIIQGNTASNYGATGYTFDISGAPVIGVGQIINNVFNNAPALVRASCGGTIYLERTYWGSAIPNPLSYSGATNIDYEPWYNSTTLIPANLQIIPPSVNRSIAVIPPNNTNIRYEPTSLNFTMNEIGYWPGAGGTPIQYGIEMSTSPVFAGTIFSIAADPTLIGPFAFRSHVNIAPAGVGYYTPGTKYYWRVRANNVNDAIWGNWVTFNFTYSQAQVAVTLSSLVNYASAGQTVTYNIDFKNTDTVTAVGNADIVSILPDDVYFGGTILLQGFNAAMGNITLRAFSDVAGTVPVGLAYVRPAFNGSQTINNNALWVTAPQNTQVRRLNINLQAIPVSNSGRIVYRSVVK